MSAKRKNFPYRVKVGSVTVTIYPNRKETDHTAYMAYIVTYYQGGKRKQESLSKFANAEKRAKEIAEDLASGVIVASQIKSEDKLALVRASEALREAGMKQAVDTAVIEYVAARAILQGRASLAEVCRDWMNRHAVRVPKISVMDAKEERIAQARADGKSQRGIAQLDSVLNRFAQAMNCNITALTPAIISAYLSAMKLKERTRRNHRDILANFSAWCVTRGYLPKETDLLEGVQTYSKRKIGEIQIYSPEELSKLLLVADDRLVPFIAIGAFAGVRHAEIARLDWSEIELSDTKGESFIEVKAHKSKVDTRRLVPVSDNLKAWLRPYAKQRGKVCPFANITKQLLKCAGDAKMEWKHNALRHSAISYRIAESADIPRAADESGTSSTMIKTNYLRRVKPKVATTWFALVPESVETSPDGP